MLIYKITNIKNNKIYIGKTQQSIKKRWNKHILCARKKINRYLYDAMNYYGYENFIIEEIDKANNKEELDKLEKQYISKYKSSDREFGYNMTEGGDGGSMSDESIKKAKETRLKNNGGVWQTKEALKKSANGIRNFYKNNPHRPAYSDEWKENISKSVKHKWETDSEFRERSIKNCHMRGKKGDKHHFFGKKHSEESKKKIGQSHLGKTTSDKHKQVVKEKWIGNKNPNFKNIEVASLIQLLKDKKSLQYISDFYGNISKQGISYKIKNIFKVSSIKEIFKMVDETTFDEYLNSLDIF